MLYGRYSQNCWKNKEFFEIFGVFWQKTVFEKLYKSIHDQGI